MKRIELRIQGGVVKRKKWPVTQGIPFADGELEKDAPLRLVNAKGTVIPLQKSILATWNKNLKYVKWLLLDFQYDVDPGREQTVWLEYGPGVEAPKEVQRISCHTEKGRTDIEKGPTTIDTGVMRLIFCYDNPGFITSLYIRNTDGWLNLLNKKSIPFLYMSDSRGNAYRSNWGELKEVSIEEQGPLRTAVIVRGVLADEQGHRFCPYILRLHLYAGKTDIHFQHTFIFDQNPNQIELTEVGMFWPLTAGEVERIAFGGEKKAHILPAKGKGCFLQTSDIFYAVLKDSEVLSKGEKTKGWAVLRGSEASAGVVLRDLWKEYPKGIEISENGIDIQFWPKAYGQSLAFTNPFEGRGILYFSDINTEEEFIKRINSNPTAALNLKSFGVNSEEKMIWVEKMVRKHAPDRLVSHNDIGVDRINGEGTAKTHEFWLRFSSTELTEREMENFAVSIQEPVIAPAKADYMSKTGVLRYWHHYDPAFFKEAEEGMDAIFETVVQEPRRILRAFGMIDYGDLMCSHSPSPAYQWRRARQDRAPIDMMKHCSRSYNNEANDQVYALWGFFAHTGDRKYFLAAEAYSEHMGDVDIVHSHKNRDLIGNMHCHGANHFGGWPVPSHTCLAGLMLCYYFTGNRRIRDIVLEVADSIVNKQELCGIISQRKLDLVREFTTPLANLLEVYQLTWSPKYGDLAGRSLRWLLKTQNMPGSLPSELATAGEIGDEAIVSFSKTSSDGFNFRHAGGMLPNILYDSLQIWPEEDAVKKCLIGYADFWVYKGWLDNFYTEKLARDTLCIFGSRLKMFKVNDQFYFEGWLDGDTFNMVIVAYAYKLTGNPVYGAYCVHRCKEQFPFHAKRVSKLCAVLFTSVCYGSSTPAMMAAAADILAYRKKFKKGDKEWRRQRARLGYDVYDGKREWLPIHQDNYDAHGIPKKGELAGDFWKGWQSRSDFARKNLGRIIL